MASAGATVQASTDQSVIQQAARRKEGENPVDKVVKDPHASLPVLLIVAGAAAALVWWKRSSAGKGRKGDSSSSRSHFAFSGHEAKAKPGSQPASSLPRNSQSTNNKKNKQRRKEEKQRQAEKRDRATAKGAHEERKRDPNDPNNHLVHNYSYWDNGRPDFLHAPAQTKKKLGS